MKYFFSGKGSKTKYYATLGDILEHKRYGEEVIAERHINGKAYHAIVGSIERDFQGLYFLKNPTPRQWLRVDESKRKAS